MPTITELDITGRSACVFLRDAGFEAWWQNPCYISIPGLKLDVCVGAGNGHWCVSAIDRSGQVFHFYRPEVWEKMALMNPDDVTGESLAKAILHTLDVLAPHRN